MAALMRSATRLRATSLNAMSVMDFKRIHPQDSRKEQPQPTAFAQHRQFSHLVPGVAAAAFVAQSGFIIADVLGPYLLALQGVESAGGSPLSGIPIAILLGFAARNTCTLPASLKPGLDFAKASILRAGIICVGAKLSMLEVATLGAQGIPGNEAALSPFPKFSPCLCPI